MKRLSLIFLVIILLAVVAGIVVLATTNIPAPKGTVEKVIPDDRFAR
jgi:Flp pilus assembly protein CpaB